MTQFLGNGDKFVFRAQGSAATNVVTIQHGVHPSLLQITTQTKEGEEIDCVIIELEEKYVGHFK
jgi:hypothetical protein